MIAGRTCPLHYRYSPALFREVPTEHAVTVYAVGGLYGNPEALAAVLDLKREEERSRSPSHARLQRRFQLVQRRRRELPQR